MPNWCSTDHIFVGDKEEVLDLFNKLTELNEMPESLVENGFGKLFLGCVIQHFGGDWGKMRCRGEIHHFEIREDGALSLHTSTAWDMLSEAWIFILSKYENIEHYYLTEESGCCYYYNNDPTGEYFPQEYIILQTDEDDEYANSESALFEDIAKRLGIEKIESIEELDKLLEAHNEESPDDESLDNDISYYTFESPN